MPNGYVTAIGLGALGVVFFLPSASADCTVNLGPCQGGSCTVNVAGADQPGCNGGNCLVNIGFCGSGGNCALAIGSQCWNGGSCLVQVGSVCDGGSCTVNAGVQGTLVPGNCTGSCAINVTTC